MKKIINFLAFVVIVGFVGAWENGSSDFKSLLLNVGITLSTLFIFHICRFILAIIKEIKKQKKQKLRRVKIS